MDIIKYSPKLDQAYNIYRRLFWSKAPQKTGNLRNSMIDTPKYEVVNIPNIFNAPQIKITLGNEWYSRTQKKDKYNYGMLLQDKRVIHNRESKITSTRMLNRRANNIKNTRRVIVRDEYGKIQRVSGNQVKHHNASGSKQWQMIGIEHNIIPKTAPIPFRVNVHYHYLDNIYSLFPNELALALGGVLHNGNYVGKRQQKETNAKLKELIVSGKANASDIVNFNQLMKG